MKKEKEKHQIPKLVSTVPGELPEPLEDRSMVTIHEKVRRNPYEHERL